MTDSTPPAEPPRDRPSGQPPRPDDNWPDFSAPTGGPPQPPPTGPGYAQPGPGPMGPGQPGPYGPGQPGPGYGPGWGGPPQPNPQEDRTLATIAHLGGIIAGFIPALIIYLIKKDTSPWARKQAAEALNFQITVAIASVVSTVLMFVIIGFFLVIAVWIINIVLCVIAGVAANRGDDYEYPSWCRFKMVT